MSTPTRAADIPDRIETINHAAWDRAYRAWERRRALPAELAELESRNGGKPIGGKPIGVIHVGISAK